MKSTSGLIFFIFIQFCNITYCKEFSYYIQIPWSLVKNRLKVSVRIYSWILYSCTFNLYILKSLTYCLITIALREVFLIRNQIESILQFCYYLLRLFWDTLIAFPYKFLNFEFPYKLLHLHINFRINLKIFTKKKMH